MSKIEFREVTLANLDEIECLRVRPEQRELVAENIYSIAQCGLDSSGWCRAVYIGDKPVGFFYVRKQECEKRAYICRFMVDQHWQGKGIGKRIVKELIDVLFASFSVEIVDLAVSKTHGGAEDFYRKCGFISTDEPYRGGWRMVLSRNDYMPNK
jgi:diamine N-acetyltransferase